MHHRWWALCALMIVALLQRATLSASADEAATRAARFAFRDEQTQKYGYVGSDGKIAIAATYAHAIDFRDGLGRVSIDNRMSFINERGEIQFTLPESAEGTLWGSEGYVWFQVDDKWGFCDQRGKVVLPPTYDDARAFSEGLARVNLGAKLQFPGIMDGGKWGYVDTSGKVILDFKYEYTYDFAEGLAKVSDARNTHYIDKQGNAVIEGRGLGDFREGLCPVYTDRSLQKKDGLTRYVDRHGDTQFEVEGYGEAFHEGLTVITRRAKSADPTAPLSQVRRRGYIDKSGVVVIPVKFAEAHPFSEGLAAVCRRRALEGQEDSWGYIDKTGRLAIWTQFNEAGEFVDGVAKVHVGGRYALVEDHPGWWEGGQWILIDRTGKKLVRLSKDK